MSDPTPSPASPSGDSASDLTSLRLRGALDGDVASLEWVIARFTPLLVSHADLLLGKQLRRLFEPEDLVAEVWAVALPRLKGLPAREGRYTPVLMRFLATTLRYVLSNLVQKHAPKLAKQEGASVLERGDAAGPLPPQTRGVVTQAMHDEHWQLLVQALDRIDPVSREIVLLKGFEQVSNQEIGERLKLLPNTVAVKYRRALQELRGLMPGTVFDEFPS